jgi:hypothetical protein
MKIYTEYKKAKVIDFCTIQIEETKEIIEVDIGLLCFNDGSGW